MGEGVLSVRQIGQYPQETSAGPFDALLLQLGGIGGPYAHINAPDLVSTALLNGSPLQLKSGGPGIEFDDPQGSALASLTYMLNPAAFVFNAPVAAPAIAVNGAAVATQAFVEALVEATFASQTFVNSFNFRTGNVQLQIEDVLRAGGAPTTNPHFNGDCTAPTIWNPNAATDSIATTAFVQQAICNWYFLAKGAGSIVTSFDGRGGDVVMTANDVTIGATQPGTYALANTPPLGDASKRIATTAFVDGSLIDFGNMLAKQSGDAPSDGNLYGRKDAAWAIVPPGLADAPSDGHFYSRENGAWKQTGIDGINNNWFFGNSGNTTATGTNNTAVGNNTMRNNVAGGGNTAIGSLAAQSMSGGANNVIVGYLSIGGTGPSTGGSNTAIGSGTLYSNTSGSNNTVCGYNSGQFITTGSYSTVYGMNAGNAIITGSRNLILGDSVNLPSDLSNSVLIGCNTNSYAVIALGDGNYNKFFGNAGNTTATGQINVAVGHNAGAAITTGSNNVAMGFTALSANTTGSSNVALGQSAMLSNVSGGSNTAIGTSALSSNTGSSNTAVGSNSGASTTTGINNSFFGYISGQRNTVGQYNTAVGSSALNAVTSGNSNTVVGMNSALAVVSGSSNLILGDGVNLTADLSGCIAIGQNSVVRADYNMSLLSWWNFSAPIRLPPPLIARASLNFMSGAAPTTLANGDMWFDGTNLSIRIGGVTRTVNVT